jgi:simple sugar transport system ATP-binding protein
MKDQILKMEKITKKFPGLIANDSIDFNVVKGEIHCLLGENGAGKTTLMNILYGLRNPEKGEIYLKGKRVSIKSPKDAMRMGIGMVHQHFMLIPTLTVAQNMVLMTAKGRLVKLSEVERDLSEFSHKHGLTVDPSALVLSLSEGEKQRVEIVRALIQGAEILILDEPTSVLTPPEIVDLFNNLNSLKATGRSIIFITHKLNEVFEVSDRVTVLRNGKLIDTVSTSNTDKCELAKMMVGREVLFDIQRTSAQVGKTVLTVEGISAFNDRGIKALDDVSVSINQGEILGIAGVAGNGQTELAQVVMGLRKPVNGKVLIKGVDVTCDTCKVNEQRVGYIPEERRIRGLFMDLPLRENLILKVRNDSPFSYRKLINKIEIRKYCKNLISDFDVKTPSIDVPAKTLSGGNLQKLILAREISGNPTLVVAEQPTMGLDVGATEYIRNKLLEQRNRGAAILLISGDLDEIMMMSDRIAVMYRGKIVETVKASEAKLSDIGLMMAGVKEPVCE